MKNLYITEPTTSNLELYKKTKCDISYWHTKDFFKFDEKIVDKLDYLLDVYMDALTDSESENEENDIFKIEFKLGRLIVKTAQELDIEPRDLKDQLNNYASVIWTPICIWKKDESGTVKYTLCSGLSGLKAN